MHSRSRKTAKQWLADIHALPLTRSFKVMNVCGGHERALTMSGIRSLLPDQIELIPGPGCPVCVCPEEDIYYAIQLALCNDVVLVAFGDMLRVPVNVKKNEIRSLEQARAAGAMVVPVAAPMEAVRIARENPERQVVFFVAGFETTTAPVAAMIAQGVPDNLSLLLAARRTWPAVSMLLQSGEAGFDALVAPGHVATVMGTKDWQFVVSDYRLPTAVAGFTPESLLAAIYSVLRQTIEQHLFLDNCYRNVATENGNPNALECLNEVMRVGDAKWRGIGSLPDSGFVLRSRYGALDAKARVGIHDDDYRKRAGEMPPGCDCAKVVLGKAYPDQCKLYGRACTPRSPIGPCMVSDEGACRIWWSAGVRAGESECVA